MNMKVQFFTALCLSASLFSAQQQDRPLTLTESIAIGGVAGATEVAFPGQLFSYCMNKKINKEPIVWRQSYKGGLTNAAGQFPITAMAKAVQVKGSQAVEGWQQAPISDLQKVGISFSSGVAAGVIDTASNAVQLYQQNIHNHGKNAVKAFQELGLKGTLRGLAPNTLMKEGPFAVGWQLLAPQGKELVHQHLNQKAVSQVFGNHQAQKADEIISTVVGGIGAGVITAIATHPGAVLRNKMQNDPAQTMYKSTLQTAQKVYEQEGMKGLFKGLPQRGSRVAIAIPLYVVYGNALETWIKDK